MKKFLSVLLLLTLLLSLSVSVFARYEVCPECGGRLDYETKMVYDREVLCEVMEEDDIYHSRYKIYDRPYCLDCGYYESTWNFVEYYIDCPH